jgi:hypothetical protein
MSRLAGFEVLTAMIEEHKHSLLRCNAVQFEKIVTFRQNIPLASCLAYSSALKMGAVCSETSGCFLTTSQKTVLLNFGEVRMEKEFHSAEN